MGTVLKFPTERRAPPDPESRTSSTASADVVILPAVRIERIAEPTHPSETPSGLKSACANERGPLWS
ncbi:hypothetical protein [Blastochloris viridis]|uniref:Uncharacterized protein n=1 Tax=Blastochloris viridis TaxID=1079 RepID=A0A0P0J957_BLAVI|nr:hypothetical protein [Blastochloris viridis]ALK10146.1 hypothetical protein BVIR_2379 [Blastochloris viridis]CUU42810.1 hypothetical protein BVIRIDIS_18250 [Blastochloris viridis]